MKKLGEIKLNQFSENELNRRKMNALIGGKECSCSGNCDCSCTCSCLNSSMDAGIKSMNYSSKSSGLNQAYNDLSSITQSKSYISYISYP